MGRGPARPGPVRIPVGATTADRSRPVAGEGDLEQDGFWAEVRGLIESRNRFVLATHVNADGDGLGAQLALGRYLARLGKDVRVINTDPIPHNYSFLPREGEVEIYDSARHVV